MTIYGTVGDSSRYEDFQLLNSSWVIVWNREWRLLYPDEVIFWLHPPLADGS